jgi:hypothetical protein
LNITSANGDITIDVFKTDFTNQTINYSSSDAPLSGVYWLKGILDVVLGYKVQFNTSTNPNAASPCFSPRVSGNVFGTVLAGSRDFRAALQQLNDGTCGDHGLLPMTSSNQTLAEMIEDLSLNATLGWMGMENIEYVRTSVHFELLLLITIRDYRNAVITITEMHNIYHYNSTKLFIAYGVGILITAINAMIGYLSFRRHGTGLMAKASTFGALLQHPAVSLQFYFFPTMKDSANGSAGRKSASQ